LPNSVIGDDHVTANRNATYNWMGQEGLDIVNFNNEELVGAEMAMQTWTRKNWETNGAEFVAEDLLGDYTDAHVIIAQKSLDAITNFSYTSAFKTRDNKLGLLQIAGSPGNPPGVKIRYKLVQTSTNSTTLKPIPPQAAETNSPAGN